MLKFNAINERIKRQYLEWEKEAKGKAESTVNNIRNAIYRFEKYTNFKNFKNIAKTMSTIIKLQK